MSTQLIWMDVEAGPKFDWEAGMAFWSPYDKMVSRHFKENVAAVRKPIIVVVPTRHGGISWFNVDSAPTSVPESHWDVKVDLATLVKGQKPMITVTPSINLGGLYHGFLTDGVLSDDLG